MTSANPCRSTALALAASITACSLAFGQPDHFESPHVHPIDMTPDGHTLLVCHTADMRLSVFDLDGTSLPARSIEIPVGIEPVTVRARTNDEAWVVNHVSDDVSVVDLTTGNVVRTLLVGDEPTDVVFAGSPERAYVCVSQEDVIRVYDPTDLDAPPVDIPLDASDPFALAVGKNGASVYVCVLDSQNRTTIVPFDVVEAGGGLPPPSPPMAPGLPPAPSTSLIVKHDGTHWVDEIGRQWDSDLPFTLLDHDVLEIDTASRTIAGTVSDVGTTLFAIAVNPDDDTIYVTGQEAFNEVRFEPNLKGKFAETRLASIDATTLVATTTSLNPHIDYTNPAGSEAERALSLSTPTGIAVSAAGTEIYVSALGSDAVAVLDPAGAVLRRIDVGAGPTGVVLDEPRNRLYVVGRFESTISVVDLGTDTSVEVAIGFDPSDPAVTAGRRLLYEGRLSSAHGDLACGTCHVFAGMDNIAWDLGDPEGEFVPNGFNGNHPMKGPMTTQSLKGLAETDPFHWRGDRTTLADFNPAFVSLLGRSSELSATEFQAFEDFLATVRYPPNPNQNLDGTLPDPPSGPNPTRGFDAYTTGSLVGGIECVDCHTLPTGEQGLVIPAQLLQEPQDMVIPQLRNMHEKTRFDRESPTTVRGFGYTHDGAVDDLLEFLRFPGFTFSGDAQREDVAAFLLAFGFETPAAVGAQWTMDGANEVVGLPRVTTLRDVADTGVIGLIAKGPDASGQARGWLYEGSDGWTSDREVEAPLTTQALVDMAGAGREITFTAVLAGTEFRLGIDRDADGYRDRDEIDAGSDPADPASTPDALAVGVTSGRPALSLPPVRPNPIRSGVATISIDVGRDAAIDVTVHDVRGRRVMALASAAALSPGRHTITWDLRDERGSVVASGLYYVRANSAVGRAVRRLVVVQ